MPMRKVLIEIFVPAASQKYDVFLPNHLLLSEAVKMIGKAAADISNGLFQSDEDTVLCNREDGAILNVNLSVEELKLRNGSQLMLI